MNDVYDIADRRKDFLEQMASLRSPRYGTKKERSGDKCAGLSTDEKVFKDQANEEISDLCKHRAFQPGKDVWFRAARNKFTLIPGTTVGPESDNTRPPVPERVVHLWQLMTV